MIHGGAVAPGESSRAVPRAAPTPSRAKETVVALVAPHTVSGVSSAMARLAGLGPPHYPWRLLAVGPGSEGKAAVGADTAGFGTVSWHPTAGVAEQVRMVRDRLRELDARVVSPNFLVHGFVAGALDHHRGRRVAAIWHGSEIAAEDLYERAAPLADAWRAVSPAIARRVSRYAPGRSGVVPMGLALPAAVTPPPSVGGGAGDAPLRLLFAGWLDERTKRVMDLAALADALGALGVDFRLTVAGRGPAGTKLAAALAGHIVAGRATLVGPVALEKMDELHRAHDVLVLVSAMEGAPVVVMEAMGHGRPVAVTRGCGGALAAVRDGESGIVVGVGEMGELARRLASLWAGGRPRELAAMGRAARAAAERCFALSRLAPEYDALVTEALASPETARDPASIALRWSRVLAALELIGPCAPAELAGLALEWLTDLGAAPVALHLTPETPALLDAVAQFGPGRIAVVVDDARAESREWMGWPLVPRSGLGTGTLVLSTRPEGAWPAGVHLLPLVLPALPTLAARLVLAAAQRLRDSGRRRVALYGAGKHTRKVAPWLARAPGLAAIIDDRAGQPGGPGPRLWGLPVVLPAQIDGLGIDGVIVSSDEHERVMLERARAWAGSRPVLGLYGELESAAGANS